MPAAPFPTEAPHDCPLCPRLAQFRAEARAAEPSWHNAPVASWGSDSARLLIVGLAPGLRGANRTGRPFTGDYAGDLLYSTLRAFGFAKGTYGASPGDSLKLKDCMVTNAVRCVPPENKPTPAEIGTCRPFLSARMAALPKLEVILALGRIAHDSTLTTLQVRKALFPFGHRARHQVSERLVMFDSFHCSRYNTNTGKLTTAMFHGVFADIRAMLDAA